LRNVVLELSPEDSLRLNVLMMQADAIKIDENEVAVYGLQGEQEMKVPLNPTGRADKYITVVRELLASVILDSPGGYPVFLRRWTRMGQFESDQLDRLLKIGEIEAVMAVVCAQGLTDELARRAWWIAPYSEYARQMLMNPTIVNGTMGPILAEHLVDHLPFETEHHIMLETVRLVLQPGLINDTQRLKLWRSGQTKATYKIGFLQSRPDEIPEQLPPRHDYEQISAQLAPLIVSGNTIAQVLDKALSANGQTYSQVVHDAMRRPADQDVISALFNAIGHYFSGAKVIQGEFRMLEGVEQAVAKAMETDPVKAVLSTLPEREPEIKAILFLGHFDDAIVIPVFSMTDAVGSVMRKKIIHISTPLLRCFSVLQGKVQR
jgi:hypothetical protein